MDIKKALKLRLSRNWTINRMLSLDKGAYLVGGAIRDTADSLIHGKRMRLNDIDIVCPAESYSDFTKALHNQVGGTIFNLHSEDVKRIALRDGVVIDISAFKGSIDNDLARRDFTINAMAWNRSSGLLDPCNGLRDIKKRTMRAISRKNLKDDPLRLVRAYRIGAELGYRIAPETRAEIMALAKLAAGPARERTTYELTRLLSCRRPYEYIIEMIESGLARVLINVNSSRLMHTVKSNYDIFSDPSEKHERIYFKHADFLEALALVRLSLLASLSNNLDKTRLCLSARETERARLIRQLLEEFKAASEPCKVFNLLEKTRGYAYDMAYLARRPELVVMIRRYETQRARPLVSGDDLIRLNVKTGPRMGEILGEVARLRYMGRLTSRSKALAFAVSI